MSAENAADQKQKRRWGRRAEPEIEEELDAEEVRGITAGKGRVTRGRRNSADEEVTGNVVTRSVGGIGEYFEGVRSELAKVTWPTREETRRLSIIVIIATILSSILLGLISLGFTELFRLGLNNPVIFLGFFIVVGALAFFFYRRNQTDNSSPY